MEPDFVKKLTVLFKEYTEDLPEKIKLIEDLFAKLKNQWDEEIFNEFYRKVHSLHGSAGIYGYLEVKARADSLESYLKPFLTSNTKAIDFSKISNEIIALKETILAASQEKAISIFLKSNIITNRTGGKNEKNPNH